MTEQQQAGTQGETPEAPAPARPSATDELVREERYRIRARYHLQWIVTTEERRSERIVATAGALERYQIRFWDCATGAKDLAGEQINIGDAWMLPGTVLDHIRKSDSRELWILRDLHDWMKPGMDPSVVRGVKSLARDLQEVTDPNRRKIVVLLGPSGDVPDNLRNSVLVVDWPLPKREEASEILDSVLAAAHREINGERERVIDAALGLTAEDMSSAFASSLVRLKRVDPAMVGAEKKRVVDRERVLTWYEPDARGLDAIGGLDALKAWLMERRLALTPQARAYGLPAPKGVLLVGVPGCGKSLTAKAVPQAWGGLPLIRIDMGALRSKYVGESEANIRRAFKLAEAVSPVVLWMDEIEKGLAGSEGRNDGGVSADALGAILTWMQERQGSVFVVATANDVSALPPELMRKGRFDEVFFVDLPTAAERAQILAATLRQFGRDPESPQFNLGKIADEMPEFSGAEVAEVVPAAMFAAFADGERDVVTRDLIAAAKAIKPMAQASAARINALREWGKTRARQASSAGTVPAQRQATAAPATVKGSISNLEIADDDDLDDLN